MNIKNRLRHLAHTMSKDRATGRTLRLMKADKDIGAIFITHNHESALNAQRTDKGLIARSMETNLEGYSGPFIIDHFAVESMFVKAANKIEELEEEKADLINTMREYLENAKQNEKLIKKAIEWES